MEDLGLPDSINGDTLKWMVVGGNGNLNGGFGVTPISGYSIWVVTKDWYNIQ